MKKSILFIIYFFCIVIILFSAACTNYPENSVEISLQDLQAVENKNLPQGENVLRVAFASITSPKETIIYYNDLLKYIEKSSGLTVQVIQRKTYQEVNDLIEAGEVDLAFICTYAYTLGTKKFGLQPFLVPQKDSKVTYQGYIIAPAGSAIDSFEDLKGKRFAFTDPLSNTGYIYPTYLIKRMGENPETFFRNTIYTYSHDNSIKAVADKIVDGAAVDALVLDYLIDQKPEIKDKIRIINTSPEFGIPPIVLSSKVPIETKEKLKNIFLTMHSSKEGRVILEHLRIERFQEQEDANYDSLRTLVDEVLHEQS